MILRCVSLLKGFWKVWVFATSRLNVKGMSVACRPNLCLQGDIGGNEFLYPKGCASRIDDTLYTLALAGFLLQVF